MPNVLRRPRSHVLVMLLLLAFVAMSASPALAVPPSKAAVEARLVELINASRVEAGVRPLRLDVRLVASARAWSTQMARKGRVSHDAAIARSLPPGVASHAENVAFTSHPDDAATMLHTMLMESAPHRRNLLDGRYSDLGVGIAVTAGRTYVTQRFASGAAAAVAPAVTGLARLATSTFPEGAEHAVIARDDVFADALTAGPLAGASGPLLLTPPGPALHPSVRVALDHILPKGRTVWLVGGPAAVSDGVAAELAAAGWAVRRVSGANRIGTAEAVARTVAQRDGRPDTVMIATADNWPDAISAGAYGARSQDPVLLTTRDAVPAETARALADLRPRTRAVLGGSAAVSDDVVRALGATRVSGSTRQGTASETARRLWGYTDASPQHWIAAPAFGDDAWTWALGSAPLAARRNAAVLLVGPTLSDEVRTYVSSLGYGGGKTAELSVIGPVPAAASDALRALLR